MSNVESLCGGLTHICTCTYIHIYTYMYTYIYKYIYMHIYIPIYMYIYIPIYIYMSCIHISICIYIQKERGGVREEKREG